MSLCQTWFSSLHRMKMRDLYGSKSPLGSCQGWSVSLLSKPACGISLVSIKAVFTDSRYNDALSLYLYPISCSKSTNNSGKNRGADGTELAMAALWPWGFPCLEGSPKLSLPYFQQYRGVLLGGLVALKLRIWPRVWSVLVGLLCSVLCKNNPDLQSLWVMSSASFSGECCLDNESLLYCSVCWRSPGCLGGCSLLIHVPLWPAIPLSVTRLIWPACGCLAGRLEAS